MKREGVKHHQDFSFPIDGSISDFDLALYGHITNASLTDNQGETVLISLVDIIVQYFPLLIENNGTCLGMLFILRQECLLTV